MFCLAKFHGEENMCHVICMYGDKFNFGKVAVVCTLYLVRPPIDQDLIGCNIPTNGVYPKKHLLLCPHEEEIYIYWNNKFKSIICTVGL